MRSILFLAIAIFMASCGGNTKKAVAKDEKADSLRRDSISKEEALEDSLEMVAWGDTRFGMTKQEVMESKAFGGGQKETVSKTDQDSYQMHRDKLFMFEEQNGLRKLGKITAHFRENELYLVVLQSFEEDAFSLDDMIHDCYAIIEQFTKRYRKPYALKENVSILDLIERPRLSIAKFVIGEKAIIVNILRKDHEYKYEIEISNYSFPKKKHKPTKEEIEWMEKQDRLRSEVRDNSF